MKHYLHHKKNKYLFISFLLFLQLAFVHAYLPIGEWFSHNAIYTDDFSFHYGHVLEKITYLKESGKMWGYNPIVNAGSIANVTTTIDNNGWALFSFLLFFLPIEVSFKLYFILGITLAPILCYKTARNFDFTYETALLSSLLGTLLMHVSVMVNFIYWGTISFIFSSYFSIFTISYFYRFCKRGTVKDLFVSTILLTATVWIHAFTVVTVCIPLFLCYAISFQRMRWVHHLSILTGVLLVVLSNLPWAYPFLLFLDHIEKDTVSFFYATNSLLEPLRTYLFRNNLFNSYMNMVFHKEEWIDIVLLLSAILGMHRLHKKGERFQAALFLGSSIFLFMISYYGSFLEITRITPMRFLIPFYIFLIFPSAVGFEYLYRLFLSDKSKRVKVITSVIIVYLLMALIAPAYYHLFYKRDFRLVCNVPEQFNQLIAWINNNTTQEGRILVENSDFETEHQYYGTHLPFLLPRWTDREYIGVYFYYATTKDSFVSYNAGFLFRKPIGSFSLPELHSYLDLYNIQWIIYWSEESKSIFESGVKDFTYLTSIDKFHICRVERNPTFFIKGSGIARASHNKINLEEINPAGGEIILSYHWMKYLKSDPPQRLERVLFLQDPIGFIKVKNPPSSLLIYNGY